MLRKLLERFDWKYAITEVILIFLGITLAIWFDDWKEARQDRETEIAVLGDLRQSLELDLGDLRGNAKVSATTEWACQVVLDHLENGRPYQDSLDWHFGRVTMLVMFVQNMAAYENLKRTGYSIVRNTDLRDQIMDYFERRSSVLKGIERELMLPLQGDLEDAMYGRFDYASLFRPAKPVNYGALQGDTEFKSLVRTKQVMMTWQVKNSKTVLGDAEELDKALEEELDRLE